MVSFVSSRRTHYIFQPAIGGFYEGIQYGHKELLSARDPWSGYIHYDPALQIIAQFSRFAETGWENVRFFLFRCTLNADMAPPEQSAIRSTIGTAAIRHILKTNGIVPDPDGDCPAGGVRVLEDAQLPIPTG